MSRTEKPPPEKSVQEFLQRWSRRKLGVAEPGEDGGTPGSAQGGEPEAGAPPLPAEASPASAAAFDPASLPPIDSIDATTDIRAFLAPGVPVELTRAALRRAWTSDPAIRDFVGIAENQWDFSNPDAVPGFGSLEFSDEVRAMVSRLFGETPAEPPQETAPTTTMAGSEHGERATLHAAAPHTPAALSVPATVNVVREDDHAALQNEPDAEQEFAQRKHGGALPK